MNTADVLLASLGQGWRSGNRQKSVFMFGAGGRLGETILAQLLSDPGIGSVLVKTTAPLASSIPKLSFVGLTSGVGLSPAEPPDVAVLVLGEEEDAALAWRSIYGRDVVFAALPSKFLVAAASALADAGIRHLVLVAPARYHLQPASLGGMAYGPAELAMVILFERVVLLRPLAGTQQKYTRSTSLGQAVARYVIGQLKVMLPASRAGCDPKRCARLVLAAVHHAEPGITVLDADALVEPGCDARRFAPTSP
jgi:hypothetical protein